MTINKETIYTKDVVNKKLMVVREFDAPVGKVWSAWTKRELLDQWWAPKPWKANTKSMDLRDGGLWLYYMEGPDGTRHYCRVDFRSVVPDKLLVVDDAFCDENGKINNELPEMQWRIEFHNAGNGTRVEVEISFATEADIETIIKMGFKEGLAAGFNNLDELLAMDDDKGKLKIES